MNLKKNKSGFTLLEIIIVIIIVGVLASLALPRFFKTVEYSRSTEALANISALRQSLERCSMQRGNAFTGCAMGNLDVADPTSTPNAHFGYGINVTGADNYTITATRNTLDGGDGAVTIWLTFDAGSGTPVTKGGTNDFSGVQ